MYSKREKRVQKQGELIDQQARELESIQRTINQVIQKIIY